MIAAKPATPATTADLAGLAGFTRINDGVAVGRKPTLDGFDALKKANYKSVVYLHAPGADPGAVRDVAEKRGLKFIAFETTPEKLPGAYETVAATIGDKAARPVYVFDDDGLRSGTVFFIHFRIVDGESTDVARIRARSIGLTDEGSEARAFWAAALQYLAAR